MLLTTEPSLPSVVISDTGSLQQFCCSTFSQTQGFCQSLFLSTDLLLPVCQEDDRQRASEGRHTGGAALHLLLDVGAPSAPLCPLCGMASAGKEGAVSTSQVRTSELYPPGCPLVTKWR